MITDPIFYAAAIPAVILIGLSKGGFGGALAMLGVPLMALVVSPLQAAGILLPILIIMDIVALVSYRGICNRLTLKIMLPGAIIGIFIGWLTASLVTEAHVRLIIGIISLGFVINWLMHGQSHSEPAPHHRLSGSFWGTLAGFTSFVSHAGGPPFQIYTLPLQLPPRIFAGTAVIFFAIVNAVKLLPFYALGQLHAGNLATSVLLMPLAPLATGAGVWLVKRIDQTLFYRITYLVLIPVSAKLIWDGLSGL